MTSANPPFNPAGVHQIQLETRVDELSAAVMDLVRICEAVRYTSGLGRHQWERVEKARALAGGQL